MAADRRSDCLEFAQCHLQAPRLTIEVASADASFRSYWRVRDESRSWIVMDAPPDLEDVTPWLDIGARLRTAGLHTPQVFATDPRRGLVLMEDLGAGSYLSGLNAASVDRLYGHALDALLTMQAVDSAGLPIFDTTRTIAEMELLGPWFLDRHLGVVPGCGDWDIIENAFRLIATVADEQPRRFMHRDYHSRNLLIPLAGAGGDERTPGIIDFQGATLGPITYDLASLLRDCYIAWPIERVDGWVEGYRQRLVAAGITTVDGAHFRRWFDLIGLQRHVKVLGLFCRLCYRDGKETYLADLPRVMGYVLDVARMYSDLTAFAELLDASVGRRDLTRPRAAMAAAGA